MAVAVGTRSYPTKVVAFFVLAAVSATAYDVTTVCPQPIVRGDNRLECRVMSQGLREKCQSGANGTLRVTLSTRRSQSDYCSSSLSPASCRVHHEPQNRCQCVASAGPAGEEVYTYRVNIHYGRSTLMRHVLCSVDCPGGTPSLSPACYLYVDDKKKTEENVCVRIFLCALVYMAAAAILYFGIRLAGHGLANVFPRTLPVVMSERIDADLPKAPSSDVATSEESKLTAGAALSPLEAVQIELDDLRWNNASLRNENSALWHMMVTLQLEPSHLEALEGIATGSSIDPNQYTACSTCSQPLYRSVVTSQRRIVFNQAEHGVRILTNPCPIAP